MLLIHVTDFKDSKILCSLKFTKKTIKRKCSMTHCMSTSFTGSPWTEWNENHLLGCLNNGSKRWKSVDL